MSTREPAKTDLGARPDSPQPSARLVEVLGRVQGVGFRPFVARTAQACKLAGWVKNTPAGVLIHIEGAPERLEEFGARLRQGAPRGAEIDGILEQSIPPGPHRGFSIERSELTEGTRSPSARADHVPRAVITPDQATCEPCLQEFDEPADRRFGYSLLGCSDCGPRFSIQTTLPFDRDRTTLASFPLCAACRQEYVSLDDRRFHAQNITCARCGPRMWLEEGEPAAAEIRRDRDNDLAAVERAGELIKAGQIVAVKGIGGFHLLCDATSSEAVRRLRERKHRERKPLAVLFADRKQLEQYAEVDAETWTALTDRAAPIVVLRGRAGSGLAQEIAPGLSSVGALLPYTPIHRTLVRVAGKPLVATSANTSDEPMPTDEAVARAELAGIADAFLMHNRPIARHADDSVVRMIGGRPVPIRIGRGLAPVRLPMGRDVPPILATGGHLKAAIALGRGREIVLGQHVGDLGTVAARKRYREVIDDTCRLLAVRPERIACDAHPDYFTTRFAEETGLPVVTVQHHHAHVASCLAEHAEVGPALGIAWDGTGYGADGQTWGGEFLVVEGASYRRAGSLLPFRLVGGDRAAREPRRSAVSVCHAAGEPPPWDAFTEPERRLMEAALRASHGGTVCTSAGRLFDAWAALIGLAGYSAYEGESALRFEELADDRDTGEFPVSLVEEPAGMIHVDWRPWLVETRNALQRGSSSAVLSARFHNTLARSCVEVARKVGLETVVLSGGCFQNRLLTERAHAMLTTAGFRVLTHRRVPPGDGGLAVGQLWVAALSS
ncbi:MAG TPA: carbamoyltransferase HypF [Isosphaeraceae bacterium]|jgi:hydrogenase maturation protein HypF|nr:carbamoyltransferase HypF [Isosphaeraceae bacterium]